MKINSINNVNFQSKIKMNKFLEQGIKTAQQNIERSEYKSLKDAKKFYDSMFKIASDESVNEVMFDINRETSEIYAYADGKKAMQSVLNPVNACDGYAAIQAVKNYADMLRFGKRPTLLDSYQLDYEIKRKDFFTMHKIFGIQLETELNGLVKDVTV